jgi:hypothetical protein
MAADGANHSSPTRAIRIGPSVSMLTSSQTLGSTPAAPGVWSSYDFLLSPHFSLGIHASFRNHSADVSLRQLTYGLLLRHSFEGPYLEYGLLLDMNFLSNRPGSGVAHDTRLAAGWEFSIADFPSFADLAYHYSRLSYFGSEKIKLDAIELTLGWRTAW